jgi:hypothetical protein
MIAWYNGEEAFRMVKKLLDYALSLDTGNYNKNYNYN